MKILAINLKLLRNEEHYQFQTEFLTLTKQYDAQALDIDTSLTDYESKYNNENEALQVIQKSATTKQIAEADNLRDIILRGLTNAINTATYHFNTNKKEAAERLKVVMDQYGNVARKSYDAETADITKLLYEFKGTYAADIATLDIADWLTELENQNNSFIALVKNRYTEKASKTELRMKSVRGEVDDAYRAIISRIEALMLINGVAAYETLVRELNIRVETYNNIIAQRKGRNTKDKSEATTSQEM